MNLDGFSMSRLTAELSAALTGGRIDHISQPDRLTLQITIRQPGKNLLLGIFLNPQNPVPYILENPLENPPVPPAFCMLMRKELETGRIARITQRGLDRIIEFEIDFLTPGGIISKTLVAELMGKYSNLILVKDGIITDALRRVGHGISRIRSVMPGEKYSFPPGADKINIMTANAETIKQALSDSDETTILKSLSDKFQGIGPVTAREISFSAGIANDIKMNALDESDIDSITNAIFEVVSSNKNGCPSIIVNENRKIIAISSFAIHYPAEGKVENFTTMSKMLARASFLTGSYIPPERELFARIIRTELARARKKAEKLEKEAAEAENAEKYKIIADNLMAVKYNFNDHENDLIKIPNIYDPENEIEITMDRRETVSQNIQNYYKKYGKLKRAISYIEEELRLSSENINYLESIETSLELSTTQNELSEIRDELIAAGFIKENKKKIKSSQINGVPIKIRTNDGIEILVGKNNYQNDRLTFKIANRDDIWLHVKNIPGSHVILRAGEHDVSEKSLMFAAKVAVFFSKAKESSNVPVDYTKCRFVKKPSGSKPGFVIFTNQKTLYVTVDEKTADFIKSANI